MATAGPNAPGTMADDSAVGTTTWTNPGNVAANDGTYAIADPASGAANSSHYLKCTNFGFAVPSGATINGVTVSFERIGAAGDAFPGNNYTKDSVVSLVKGGTVSGDNKADTATVWPSTANQVATYGGAADLWGLTLSDNNINASTFGVVISVAQRDRFGSGTTGGVDYVTITITYTAGAGGLSIPVASQSYRQRRV